MRLPLRPRVFRGLMEEWPCYKQRTWSIPSLEKRFGEVLFSLGVSAQDEREPVLVRLRDFLRDNVHPHSSSERNIAREALWRGPYVFDPCFEVDCEAMLAEYSEPHLFAQSDLLHTVPHELRPDHRWLLVGGAGSGSELHVDPCATSAWNALAEGEKLWLWMPPIATTAAAVCDKGKAKGKGNIDGNINRNGNMNMNVIGSTNGNTNANINGSMNTEERETKTLPSASLTAFYDDSSSSSSSSYQSEHLSRIQRHLHSFVCDIITGASSSSSPSSSHISSSSLSSLASDDTCAYLQQRVREIVPSADVCVCVQRRGETVFVPAGWPHAVLNLSPTVAVTHNIVQARNAEAFLRCYRRERMHCWSDAEWEEFEHLFQKNMQRCR